MAEINERKLTLDIKLVFYGPALSGKTTNLICLHDLLCPQLKSEMMILETKNDRTLFFDLLPLGLRTATGLLIKVKLYTVPGQVAHDSTRKAVLSRADGVIFVADSQISQRHNNSVSFENLMENMAKVGLSPEKLPIVVQFNKRDLTDIISEEEVVRLWEPTPWEVIFASALRRWGVVETFKLLLSLVYDSLDPVFLLNLRHQLPKSDFEAGLIGNFTSPG